MNHLESRTRVGKQLKADHGAAVLTGCRDIWCRDYMPVQVGGQFVQFLYAPSYVVEDQSYWRSITPPGLAYPEWLREPDRVRVVPLVLDGGSIIGNDRVALVSERVFRDNIGWTHVALEHVLAEELSVAHVEFIPEQDPHDDFTGHLDGSIRIVSPDRVVVGVPPNDYNPPSGCRAAYQRARKYSDSLTSIARRLQFDVLDLIDVSYCAPLTIG